MTFTEHLAELRTRLIRSCGAIFVSFILCYILSDYIFQFLRAPLSQIGGEGATVLWTTFNPLEAFIVKLRLSMYASVLVSSPVILYQIAAFIFPGLTASERTAVKFLLGGCMVFAIFGVAVAYAGVLPLVMPYLLKYVPEGVVQQFRMQETIAQILLFLVGFAVAFQFPMVVLVLVYLDLLSPATLKKFRRFAIVGMAIVAAILTPPDPVSMTMMLVPMVILYEASIWMSYAVIRRKRRAAAAAAAADKPASR